MERGRANVGLMCRLLSKTVSKRLKGAQYVLNTRGRQVDHLDILPSATNK